MCRRIRVGEGRQLAHRALSRDFSRSKGIAHRALLSSAFILSPMSSRLHPLARLVVTALGLLVLLNLAGLALALGFAVFSQVQTPGQTVEQTIARTIKWSADGALALTLFAYPVGLIWLGFCRAKFDVRSFVSLGLRRSRAVSNIGRGVVAGVLSIAVIWAIMWLTGAISVTGWSDAAKQAGAASVFPLAGWLLAFAAVGFFEELVFRGYALHNLIDWLGWKWAVVIQATVFALIHLGNVVMAPKDAQWAALGAMPSIFLIGVFFALCYRKTGSLWFPIGFHAAWNFSLGCLFSLPVSGIKTFQLLGVQSQTQSWMSGGSFGAEGSFFLIPVIGALIWLMSQAPDHPQAMLDLELTPAPAIAPPIVAAPIAETTVAEATEDRENRYSTKFGTSEGFDEGMLRELRELQQQRERAEAEANREQARERAAQTAVVEVELLKPPIAIEEAAPEPVVSEVEAPIVVERRVEAKPVEIAKEVRAPVEEKVNEEVEAPGIAGKPAPLPVPAKKKASPKW